MPLHKLLERITGVIAPVAVAIWCAACGYIMSWSGHRPIQPDPTSGRIYAFNNHGIMYVSAQDLFWWHLGAGSAIALAVIAGACGLAAKRFGQPQP